MKKMVIAFVLIFSSITLSAKEDNVFNNACVGAGYMFGNQPSEDFASIELQLHRGIDEDFFIGFDTFFGFPLGDSSPEIIGFKPSIGFFAHGSVNSKFKLILSASSGMVSTTMENSLFEDDTYYGTISAIDINVIYMRVGLTLTGFTINTNNYYNSGGNIGLKFWF